MDKTYKEKETRRFVLTGILLFGITELTVVYLAFPNAYTHYLLLIPVYFLMLGVSILLALSRMKRKQLHPAQAIARLMLFNVAQMLLSFFLLAGYYFLVDVQEHTIFITFSVFYIYFMGLKFFILYNIDKQYKLTKKSKQEQLYE